jgi:peptidyl-prolyl cis-trans isomerase SDCCAG10
MRAIKSSISQTASKPTHLAKETYHGQLLDYDDSDDDSNQQSQNENNKERDPWFAGKLKFVKHIDDNYRLGGDGRDVDDYAVIDSRKVTKKAK